MRMTRLLAAAATLSLAGSVALAGASAAGASPAGRGDTQCNYRIAFSHIHTWRFPGGKFVPGNREQSTLRLDKFHGMPGTIARNVHGIAWIEGTDVRNGHFGWVGAPYLFDSKCELFGH